MRILTRYVLVELLKVFSVSLTAITFFILLFVVFQQAYIHGLGAKQAAMIVPYLLPVALRFAVPATILFAACSVFGRLASGNEVVAVKSSGISPMVLLLPTFALAFLLSLVAVWLNDMAASWSREGMTRVIVESLEEIAYSRLQRSRSFSTKQFAINVKDVDGKRLMQPEITFQGDDDEPPMTISCEEATMRSDFVAQTLTITCHNGVIQMGEYSAVFPDSTERVIPLNEAGPRSGSRSPSDLAMHAIPIEKEKQGERIASFQQQLAAKAAYQLITGDFPVLTSASWEKDQQRLSDAHQRLYRLEMEPYRRWANGFSCLCFVIVGAPLAVLMRSSDFLSSFFACFLPILLVYYPLLMFGVAQTKTGDFPPYAVWAGNLILAGIGIWLVRRVNRY